MLLRFHHGPMSSGKSMMLLAAAHALAEADVPFLLATTIDRGGDNVITSRTGLSRDAVQLAPDVDVVALWREHGAPSHVLVDEASFATAEQVDAMARLVDEHAVEVDCFGLTVDFRGLLPPGAKRLFEVADEVVLMPVRGARCWCGRPGRFNARLVDGEMVTDGPTVVVGDTADGGDGGVPHVAYVVLCRPHFMAKMPSATPAQRRLPLA